MNDNLEKNSPLPLWRNLYLAYIFSTIIALVMVAVSIIGLLYQDTIYPTEKLLLGLVPTDIINLAIGVPVLLVSMWPRQTSRFTLLAGSAFLCAIYLHDLPHRRSIRCTVHTIPAPNYSEWIYDDRSGCQHQCK